MGYRADYLSDNTDKKIEIGHCYSSMYGVSKYNAKWYGNWSTEDLINYADNGVGNYGGRIDNIVENSDGSKSGVICVYYD